MPPARSPIDIKHAGKSPDNPLSPPAAIGRAQGHGQSRITTAEMLFFGEPSISLSE